MLTFLFDPNGFYVRLADRLLDNLPWHRRIRRRGHWLCACLNELSKGLNPTTYAKFAHKPVRNALLTLGFPRFVAETLGAATVFGMKKTLAAIPTAHLAKALRAVIPLVCPDLDVCPTRSDVVKTLASPMLAAQLKSLATGT